MSTMHQNPGLEGNPHFIDVTCISDQDDAMIISTVLTLAYEQRTANLIALLGKNVVVGEAYLKLQIKQRLGMDPDE